jgi:hypothetical protein
MPQPTYIRSTAGFRFCSIYELYTSGSSQLGMPLGAATLEPMAPYLVTSGSTIIAGSTVSLAAGVTCSGSVGYYGITISGAKTLTITDPQPRVIPHIGDDGVFALQVLPSLEPVTGDLQVDKTNDSVDVVVSAVKKVTVGQMNIMGQSTNKRGFENQVGVLAYAAAEDTDPNSTTFGALEWDFRIIPKAILYNLDTGYGQEANMRNYKLVPNYATAHIWQTQYTTATDGYTRAQLERGVSQYKPVLVSFLGDGSTKGFPFDSNRPPVTDLTKVSVWKNGVALPVSATMQVTATGLGFTVAPLATDVLTVLYETS